MNIKSVSPLLGIISTCSCSFLCFSSQTSDSLSPQESSRKFHEITTGSIDGEHDNIFKPTLSTANYSSASKSSQSSEYYDSKSSEYDYETFNSSLDIKYIKKYFKEVIQDSKDHFRFLCRKIFKKSLKKFDDELEQMKNLELDFLEETQLIQEHCELRKKLIIILLDKIKDAKFALSRKYVAIYSWIWKQLANDSFLHPQIFIKANEILKKSYSENNFDGLLYPFPDPSTDNEVISFDMIIDSIQEIIDDKQDKLKKDLEIIIDFYTDLTVAKFKTLLLFSQEEWDDSLNPLDYLSQNEDLAKIVNGHRKIAKHLHVPELTLRYDLDFDNRTIIAIGISLWPEADKDIDQIAYWLWFSRDASFLLVDYVRHLRNKSVGKQALERCLLELECNSPRPLYPLLYLNSCVETRQYLSEYLEFVECTGRDYRDEQKIIIEKIQAMDEKKLLDLYPHQDEDQTRFQIMYSFEIIKFFVEFLQSRST